MNLKDYILESVQDNVSESITPKAASNKVSKFLKKEQMDMSKQGFGGFEGGVKLFVAFFKELIDDLLTEINFDEFKPLNANFGVKYGGISDSKHQRYFEKALKPRAYDYASKIAEICKWDADICATALNNYFKEQGVDVAMITSNVKESADIFNMPEKTFEDNVKSALVHIAMNDLGISEKAFKQLDKLMSVVDNLVKGNDDIQKVIADGSTKRVEYFAEMIYDKHGDSIKDSMKVEESNSLEKGQELRYANIDCVIESIKDGIVTLDIDGEKMEVNESELVTK